jgi:hypothetical protein
MAITSYESAYYKSDRSLTSPFSPINRRRNRIQAQRRGKSGGNNVDMETDEWFRVSGVKKNGEDRHWAGSGKPDPFSIDAPQWQS